MSLERETTSLLEIDATRSTESNEIMKAQEMENENPDLLMGKEHCVADGAPAHRA